MKKFLLSILMLFVLTLVACGSNKPVVSEIILNGDFELGVTENWEGWTREKSAFSPMGVVEDATSLGIDVEKTGKYWYSGLAGGTQRMTGELISNEFKLTGLGYIGFKMGAAKNESIHVDFYVVGNSEPVVSVTNTDFNEPWITVQLIRKVVDLREHLGKVMYVKVVDNDDNDDFGYVNLDDFVIVMNDVQLQTLNAERTEQLERLSEPLFEEDETLTTIVNGGFETGDLTGWKILSGSAFTAFGVVPTSQKYWNDSSKVYGWGEYYFDGNNNGETPESYVGAMRSTKFTLAGDGWVSFMIGAAPSLAYVAIVDGNTNEELIQVTNTSFNDPKFPLTLGRVYVDASEYLGKVLYIKVVDDNSSSGFAFINVDDFRVSLTETDVQTLMLEQYNAIMAETEENSYGHLQGVKKYYEDYEYPFALPVLKFETKVSNKVLLANESVDLTAYLAEASAFIGVTPAEINMTKVVYNDTVETLTGFETFDLSQPGVYKVYYEAQHNDDSVEIFFVIQVSSSIDVINGGFELGDLTGWTVVNGEIDVENAIDTAQTHWGEELSFNKSGDYHFNGWQAKSVESEGYAIQSSTFTLSGSGWISFKLGGNAAYLKVYEADTNTLVGYYTNIMFKDEGFPSVQMGRWATMTTYFADLSVHIGKDLYIVLGDDETVSGWAVAFFDDVKAHYEEVPVLSYDEVLESILPETHPNYVEGTRQTVQLAHEIAVNALIINGGFETGDLAGWSNISSNISAEAIVNKDVFWNENISYNRVGSYHFDGWSSGATEEEGYSLQSSNFYLRGSGYISFRLGGKAAYLKVYDAKTNELIGHYTNELFADVNFPYLGDGSRLATMNTYFADLSEHVGKELYIVIGDDETTAGWAIAVFDEIITYFAATPTLTFDEVNESGDRSTEKVQLLHTLATNLVVAVS